MYGGSLYVQAGLQVGPDSDQPDRGPKPTPNQPNPDTPWGDRGGSRSARGQQGQSRRAHIADKFYVLT